MSNIIPFFELNGNRYEIKRTRYLLAEYDKISEENNISDEDKANAVKIQNIIEDVKKYAEKVKELEEKYFETFDDEDERRYLKVKALYDQKLSDLTELEVKSGSTARLQKESVDLLEKIAIKGLAEQYFNMDMQAAEKLWCAYVDTVQNHNTVVEWLSAMAECLFVDEGEEENPFLSQMRKKREQQSQSRKIIKTK